MNLLLVRVDDRFIHGQILESWIPYLKAQSVVVVNDILAGDHFQKTIMSMAIPDRITLRIVSLDEVACLAQDSELADKRTLLIVASIRDAHELYARGLHVFKLNLGNNKGGQSPRQISYSVWVDQEELRMIRDLIDHGVDVSLQSVPRERIIDMKTILSMVEQ